ncbi:transcription elongation factor TFIIS/CRSP70 [Tanacetum coccineum]
MLIVSLVYESLKKLHKMGLSFKVMDAAGIGITVSRLQDHVSKEVKQIANMIIGPWMRRAMVQDELAKNNVSGGLELNIRNKDTGIDEVFTGKGLLEYNSKPTEVAATTTTDVVAEKAE